MRDDGSGIGRTPHAFARFERAQIIEAFEERLKKGQGGTHEGTRRAERKPKR